jgi:hypothetical protein
MAVSAFWDLSRIPTSRGCFSASRLPFLFVNYSWHRKLPGAIAFILPRFRLLKEWVYAGMFFIQEQLHHIFRSAMAFANWIEPALFALFTIVSRALRPFSRKLV